MRLGEGLRLQVGDIDAARQRVHIRDAKGNRKEGFAFPAKHSEKWIVNRKSVGSGEQAFVFPGRYWYRGVTQEKDILPAKMAM